MEELLLLRGVLGRCPDCGEDRIMLPVDEDGLELCCTDCDGAFVLVEWAVARRADRRVA